VINVGKILFLLAQLPQKSWTISHL
jgi:hypothetical protein